MATNDVVVSSSSNRSSSISNCSSSLKNRRTVARLKILKI